MYDIVIVGGGPAGMTAAIYGLRAGKKVMLIEGMTFGGQITLSPCVENYPGFGRISGNELAVRMTEQVTELGAELEYTNALSIRDEKERKMVITEDGEIAGRTIILAPGVSHRRLDVQGEDELIGAGVSYCAVCDGAFFKGKDVAVVGGGSTALNDAVYLSRICRSVSLIHRRDKFRGETALVQKLEDCPNVKLVQDSVVTGLNGTGGLNSARVRNQKTGIESTLEIAGLFIAIGQIPNNIKFADTVELDGQGYITASEDCRTNVPGIFAAGDCRTKEVRQLTTAAADGAAAALAACRYIEKQ